MSCTSAVLGLHLAHFIGLTMTHTPTHKDEYSAQLIDAIRAGGDVQENLVYVANCSYNTYAVLYAAIAANSCDYLYHLMERVRYEPLDWSALLKAAANQDPRLSHMIVAHQKRHCVYHHSDTLVTQYLQSNKTTEITNILPLCNPLRVIERAQELTAYSTQVDAIALHVQREHESDFHQILHLCSFEQFVDYLSDPENQKVLRNYQYDDRSALGMLVARRGAHIQYVEALLNIVGRDVGNKGLRHAIGYNHFSTIDCLLRHSDPDVNFDECFYSALSYNELPFPTVHKIIDRVSNTAFIRGIDTMFLDYLHNPTLLTFERDFIDLLDARFTHHPMDEFENACHTLSDPHVKQWVLNALKQTAHHQKTVLVNALTPTHDLWSTAGQICAGEEPGVSKQRKM